MTNVQCVCVCVCACACHDTPLLNHSMWQTMHMTSSRGSPPKASSMVRLTPQRKQIGSPQHRQKSAGCTKGKAVCRQHGPNQTVNKAP